MKHATILVVEDEEIISMDILMNLENLHYYPLCTVRTGDEAVVRAREYVPDVVLMDIGIPGTMDGIEAARIIIQELNIPVIFVTSFADDAIIERAKLVNPYGYVVKPFTDRDLKVAIEIALSRKSAEILNKQGKKQEDEPVNPAGGVKKKDEKNRGYASLPDIRTLLLKDFINDIVLLLYTTAEVKEPVFTSFIERSLKNRENLLFAYSVSKAHRNFLDEIQQGKMKVCRINNGEMSLLIETLSDYCERSDVADPIPLRVIIDFSERFDQGDILAAVDLILAIRKKGVLVSGIIALAVGTNDHNLTQALSLSIPKVIVTTSWGTVISCPDHSFPLENLSFLSQDVLDETVKKVLEPVILSLLDKPISGHDILREIQIRYNILIPKARVYTYLYALQKMGYLCMRTKGKSKVYYPTETGKKYIRHKLNEFQSVFHHILADMTDRDAGINGKDKKE